MKKKFNFIGYKKLLDMENRGEIVFFDTNYFKLLRYQMSVGKQLIYNRKEDYYSIINKYLNKTLTIIEFRTQFLAMEKEDMEKGSLILGNTQELEVFDLCEDYYIFKNR